MVVLLELSSLAWVSTGNKSSKSWSASIGISTPWLGLVSIPLRRLAQACNHSPDSASLYCEDTLVTTCWAQGNGKLLGAQDFQRVCEWVLNIDIQPELLSSLGCAYLNLCLLIARGCLLAERHICTRIVKNSFAHPMEILSFKELAIPLRLGSSDESVFTIQTGWI